MSSEVEKLRDEVMSKVSELESRVGKIEEELNILPNIVEASWRIAQLESSAQRILSHSRSPLITLPMFEQELSKYFDELKELITILRDASMPMNWSLIGRSASTVLRAAKEAGISFGLIANLMIERLGDYAAKIIDENVVGEVYGLAELEYWRRLLRK
ncbi:MAG: hypothetical protein J7L17_01855 [Thaumarchaeota archaeon]|nr:hypothetical protein [Nitrososphaerota archaeon]